MDACFHFFSGCIYEFSFPFRMLGYMVTLFNILRNYQMDFPKWQHYFIFLPTVYEASTFSESLATLVMVCLFDSSQRTVYEMYLIMILICIFLTTNDAEHIFIWLLAIYISSLEKYLFRFFVHFLIGLFIFLLSSLYILDKSSFSDIWFIFFSSILWLSSYFLNGVLWSIKSL